MHRALTLLFGSAALALPTVEVAGAAASLSSNRHAATTKTAKFTGASANANQWGSVQINVTLKTTIAGKKVTRKFTDLGGSYTLPHLALAVHHVAGPADSSPRVPDRAERQHSEHLRRDLHQSGVHPVAPVGAAEGTRLAASSSASSPIDAAEDVDRLEAWISDRSTGRGV